MFLGHSQDAFQSLMSQYALYLHEAIREEKVTSEEMRLWPLDEGVQRVNIISKDLAIWRPLTSAMATLQIVLPMFGLIFLCGLLLLFVDIWALLPQRPQGGICFRSAFASSGGGKSIQSKKAFLRELCFIIFLGLPELQRLY